MKRIAENVALPSASLSLCSGVGGLDRGFHGAFPAARTVGYVEREAYAAATLVERMGKKEVDQAPIWGDLLTFDGKPWRGRVDTILAGTPCQDLSLAGLRAGIHGERSRLFFEAIRVARESGADFFLWENVAGAERELPAVFAALEEAGYRGHALRLSVSQVGGSHVRRRIFVFAYTPAIAEQWRSVADSNGSEGREQPRRRGGEARPTDPGFVGEPGEEVADDHGIGRGERADEICGRQSVIAGSGEDLAHHHHHGRESERRPGSDEVPCRNLADRCGCAAMAAAGVSNVADTRGEGFQGGELSRAPGEREGAPRSATERGGDVRSTGFPDFAPPGPHELERWVGILEVRPDLAPSESKVRRVADGVATGLDGDPVTGQWADRLRVLGNGVHELQAAVAFSWLASKAFEAECAGQVRPQVHRSKLSDLFDFVEGL